MTARSAGRRSWRRDPAKTQWGSDGLRAALENFDQRLQQHLVSLSRDHPMMACLWLHSWSKTAECFLNTILKDGLWHATWYASTWRCHFRRNCFRCLWRFGVRDHGAHSAEARGAGFPFHQWMDASMACRERVRYGSWMLLARRLRAYSTMAQCKSAIVGPKHLGLFAACFGVWPQSVDNCPEFQSMLESFWCKNVLDDRRSELVFRATPHRRHNVARPNWALVFKAGFLRMPFRGWKNWQING